MTAAELDALILKAQKGECNPYEQSCMAFELVTYRSMALRLERCVHELVKENDKAQEELKDIDRQINLRLMATNAMEKATARLDEAMVDPCQ